ncbi:hypothetical protein TrCOL_g6526 [Triparma columacea]|uniref:Uncharacterized protein n=1 Tax=Triparma columacea TaxID=722753 RepID=A0A9W7GK23_9STRA|nr:hypothetical protein TrCOL_g6526 [Triparma columacea]
MPPKKSLKSAATAVVAAKKADKLAKSKAAAKEWAAKRAAQKKEKKSNNNKANSKVKEEEDDPDVAPPPKKKAKSTTKSTTTKKSTSTPKAASSRSTRGKKRVVEETEEAAASPPSDKKKRKKTSTKTSPPPPKSTRGRSSKVPPPSPVDDSSDSESEKGPNGTPVKDRTSEAAVNDVLSVSPKKKVGRGGKKADTAKEEAREAAKERAKLWADKKKGGEKGKVKEVEEVIEEEEEEEEEEKVEEEVVETPKRGRRGRKIPTPKTKERNNTRKNKAGNPTVNTSSVDETSTPTSSPTSVNEGVETAGKAALIGILKLLSLALTIVVTGGGLNYLTIEYITPYLTSVTPITTDSRVCYNDKFMSKRLDELTEKYGTESTCRIEDTVEICPSEATCYLGKVRDCDHLGHGRFLQLHEDGGSCVLGGDGGGESDVDMLLEALAKITLEHTCHCWGLSRFTETCTISVMEKVEGNGGHPMFVIDMVSKKAGIGIKDAEFISHVHEGVMVGEDGTMIGLTGEYAKRNLEFPFTCYLQVIMNDVAWYCWRATLALFVLVAKTAWKAFLIYPVGVGGGLAFAAVAASVRRRRRRTAARLECVLNMKGEVHRILQDSSVGLSAAMIRDDVLNSMEPKSAKRRRGLEGTWGVVLKQIKTDSRIRVAEGVNEATGEVEVLFTWVYTPRKKGGRKEKEEEGEGGKKGGRRKVVIG